MLRRARLLIVLVGALVAASLVLAGEPAAAAPATSARNAPNVAWSKSTPTVTHQAAPAAAIKTERALTLHSYGVQPNGVHPADVPMYYHRCWSFIDATFHTSTKNCDGDVYRFSTYNDEYEFFDAERVKIDSPPDPNAFDVEYHCYHFWPCASTIGMAQGRALLKGWQLAKTAWSWFKTGWEWFCAIYCADDEL